MRVRADGGIVVGVKPLQPNGIVIPDDGGEHTLTGNATIFTTGLLHLSDTLIKTVNGTRINPNGFVLTMLDPSESN